MSPSPAPIGFPMRLLSTALLLAVAGTVAADDAPALKKGERIVFLGDSITEAGARGKGYVVLIKNALAEKHPDFAAPSAAAKDAQ